MWLSWPTWFWSFLDILFVLFLGNSNTRTGYVFCCCCHRIRLNTALGFSHHEFHSVVGRLQDCDGFFVGDVGQLHVVHLCIRCEKTRWEVNNMKEEWIITDKGSITLMSPRDRENMVCRNSSLTDINLSPTPRTPDSSAVPPSVSFVMKIPLSPGTCWLPTPPAMLNPSPLVKVTI